MSVPPGSLLPGETRVFRRCFSVAVRAEGWPGVVKRRCGFGGSRTAKTAPAGSCPFGVGVAARRAVSAFCDNKTVHSSMREERQ